MHAAGADFAPDAPQRAVDCRLAGAVRSGASAGRRGRARTCAGDGGATRPRCRRFGRKTLPAGVIHADLFPDNVFFLADKLSGLIDFYFACNDFLAYDFAICLNSWAFEASSAFNLAKGAGDDGRLRSASGALTTAEVEALPTLARGSALRFMLTRLVDWLNVPAGALVKPKDPLRISAEAALPHGGQVGARLRLARVSGVEIWTDGACSGNPGPGGWGAILRFGETVKELCGGEALTTNNRMELTAAISALEALKRRCDVDLHTDSQYLRQGVTSWLAGWKTQRLAHRRPQAGEERGPLAAA